MNSHTRANVQSLGLLIIRLGIGGYMLTHGWGKLQMLMAGNADQFADPLGIGSTVSLILVIFAELVCAALVMAGVLTRLACVPLVFTMLVAAFVAHGNDPWTMAEGRRLFLADEATSWASKQPALMYMVVFLGLIFTGAGRFAVDSLIFKRKSM